MQIQNHPRGVLVAQQTQKSTISDEELDQTIKKVIEINPKAVADYKSGRQQALMFLVGQAMREVKGKAEAAQIKQKLITLISKLS